MDFPKSWAVLLLLAVMIFAIGLLAFVYVQGGLGHSVWLTQ